MSQTFEYGGQPQTIPGVGDTGYGPKLIQYWLALAAFGFQSPADFSNGVLQLRQVIQTITPNSPTYLTVIPDGNNTNVALQLYTDSALANGSTLFAGSDGTTHAYLQSGQIGTGQVLPLDLQVGNSTAIRITPSGRVLINTTTDDGVHNLQVNGTISGTSFTGLALAGNLAGGAAGSVVYQTSPTTTGFLPIGASGNILTASGSTLVWTAAPAGINVNYVNARSNVGTNPYTNTMFVDHGGIINTGSPIVTIPVGPGQFNSSMVGMNIYVSGMSSYTTIATYISPTQVTMSINATSTQFLSQVAVWNSGQDDTANLNSFFASAGGSQAQAYAPTGVYVVDWTALNPIPSSVQGFFGDGLNRTVFISKTKSTSVHAGGFIFNNVPSNFTLGGKSRGFTVIGPGVYASQQLIGSSITIANGIATVAVSNSNTAVVGSVYRITGARGTASPYNDTYWTVTSSNSSQWVGTPTYWDGNPALGNITSVTVDGSGNLTTLDSNAKRKIGYSVNFSGIATATFLNGNSYSITSVNYATPGNPGSGIVGYNFANTGLSTYATAADSGIGRYLADVATVTDNFVSFPNWDGIRVICNEFPTGSNIAHHLHMNDIQCSQFQGAGFRVMTPNFGDSGTLTANSCSEGINFESAHATTGYFTNPSCYVLNGGCEAESCTFTGLYVRNFGGGVIEMPGIGGCGIAVILYNCSGTTLNGADLEVQTPWASQSTLYPGHSIELRASTGLRINPCYISFNNSAAQIGCYMWDTAVSCVYERSRHFLAGGNVQPTNEVWIDGTCIGCEIIEPELVGLNTTHFTVNGSTNTIKLKNVVYNSNSTNITTWSALSNVGSVTVNAVQSPHVTFTNGTNSQTWNVGYNAPSTIAGFFDNITASWGLQISDTLHVVTLPGTVASSSVSTGTLVVKGGVGIAGALNVGNSSTITNTVGSALLTITGTTLAQTDYVSSINSQQYNVGYNQGSLAFNIFDATGSAVRLSIADTTGQATFANLLHTTSGIASSANISISNVSNPQLQLLDTGGTPQNWNIGHNTVGAVLNFFDATASQSRMTIADITGVVKMLAGVASTTSTTGTLVVTGGVGVSAAINAGTTITAGTGLTVTTGSLAVSSGNITASGTISAGGHLVPTVNNTPTFTTVGTPGAIGSSTLAVFPSGYIEATGISTSVISGGSTGTITFPTAFPTNCWNVQVTCFDAGTNAFFYGAVASFSASSFVWYNNTGGGTPYVMWRAIGN